jgi:hypothetical protein
MVIKSCFFRKKYLIIKKEGRKIQARNLGCTIIDQKDKADIKKGRIRIALFTNHTK